MCSFEECCMHFSSGRRFKLVADGGPLVTRVEVRGVEPETHDPNDVFLSFKERLTWYRSNPLPPSENVASNPPPAFETLASNPPSASETPVSDSVAQTHELAVTVEPVSNVASAPA